MTSTTVLVWVGVVLFAAVSVIWLLDMVGVLTIRSPSQRTILNSALGVTLLGGLASIVVAAFDSPQQDTPVPREPVTPAATPSATPATPPVAAGSDSAPPKPRAASPAATPEPPTTASMPQTACQQATHPPRLTEWATPALGTPPSFRCAIAAPYPSCTVDLRERNRAEISRAAARACGAELLAFRRTHISPAYAAKLTYQDNLDAAEASLRNPRNTDEEDQRDYVIAEIARMNGRAWAEFTDLDQRSRSDMLACQSNDQRCLLAP